MKTVRMLSLLALLGSLVLSACEKKVEITRIVTEQETVIETVVETVMETVVETVIETVVKECTPEVREVEVTRIVEVTATPDPNAGVPGTLRYNAGLAFGGDENLDPVDPARFWPPISLLFDRLTAPIGNELRPGPSLAHSWESNMRADEWTFYIRDDAYFHDGSQLTAADVIYSAWHWRNSETSVLADTFDVIKDIQAPEDFVVVFYLSQHVVDFPLLLMDYRARVVPEDGFPEILETGIGSGPFKLEKMNARGVTVLVANDDYWGGAPGVAAVEILTIADIQAGIQALRAGQIDFSVDAVVNDLPLFEGNEDFVITQVPSGDWSGFVMRTDMPPFDNLALRQAMHLLVDRQAMVDLALEGAGTVSCDTPVMPGDPYHWTADCPQDIQAAQEKLVEAGYTEGLQVDLYTSDICTDWMALAEIYQQQAALAGIDVNVETVPAGSFWLEDWMVHPFVMTCWEQRAAEQVLNEIYRGGVPWNESYWKSPDFDALLDAARAETDPEARRQRYLDAQSMLHQEGGTIIPYFRNRIRVQKACVEGIPDMDVHFMDWTGITKPASCD